MIRSLSRIWLPELQNTKHVLFNNVGILVLKRSKKLELVVSVLRCDACFFVRGGEENSLVPDGFTWWKAF